MLMSISISKYQSNKDKGFHCEIRENEVVMLRLDASDSYCTVEFNVLMAVGHIINSDMINNGTDLIR